MFQKLCKMIHHNIIIISYNQQANWLNNQYKSKYLDKFCLSKGLGQIS